MIKKWAMGEIQLIVAYKANSKSIFIFNELNLYYFKIF